jgi:hypothetical protein
MRRLKPGMRNGRHPPPPGISTVLSCIRERAMDVAPRLAMNVRQPWAELIVRGIKTLEVRTRPTRVRGRVHIFASPGDADSAAIAGVGRDHQLDVDALPRGKLVGTVEIIGARQLTPDDSEAACFDVMPGAWGWELAWPRRATRLVAPKNAPKPVFFRPF